jgi:inositol-hexakisphosphate/diphosphoinositol-pentakisphosphate 1-kinase
MYDLSKFFMTSRDSAFQSLLACLTSCSLSFAFISVLHNPHLGLSVTLHRLYELAKSVADCVVPQEYGTTPAERHDVGVKICHSLLEKIAFDLKTSRTDKHHADIRYLINMDYSADLPINTMGRRVRTRLYFTSESHLHTVLNALRFTSDGSETTAMFSEEGIAVLNETPELCYLTHVVMRVFEDAEIPPEDPRRFRVESKSAFCSDICIACRYLNEYISCTVTVLFSAGATAAPLHLDETDREMDPSRLDTAPLQMIGREGLTCEEVEDFLELLMQEAGDGNEGGEDMSTV